MKRLLTLLFILMMISSSKATVYLDETFSSSEYTIGADLRNVTGWIPTIVENINGATRTVESSALTYQNYILSGVGNKVHNDYNGVSGANFITSKEFTDADITTGTVYLSFLFQAIKKGGSTYEAVGLTDVSGSNTAVKLWCGQGSDTNTQIKLGITRGNTTATNILWAAPTNLQIGVTYFIVIKYDITSATAELFINPTIGSVSAPDPDALDNSTANQKTKLRYLTFRSNGASQGYYYAGGIRVSSTWTEAVAPVQEASTVTLTLEQPAEGGSLSASPAQTVFDTNEEVTITATPTGNYVLQNFIVNGTPTPETSMNTLVLTMDGNKTVSAVFEDPTAVTEWIINPSRGSNRTNFDTANGFVKKSDRSTVGRPDDGDIVYVESGRLLGLTSQTSLNAGGAAITVSIISEEGGSILAGGGCTLASLSMTNSTLYVTDLSNSRTITINDTFNLEGNNIIEVGGTTGGYLKLGANGTTGNTHKMKMTGSGIITKKGNIQLIVTPNSDLQNNTTFSGKWIIQAGNIYSKDGSSTDKRCDFYPGESIEIQSGASYTIEKMYRSNGFVSGDLSGQTIIVKDGGVLNINPQASNPIGILQKIDIEAGGTFNINETNGAGTTLTVDGDLTLQPGAIYNVNYGAKSGETFTLKDAIFKATQTSASGFVVPDMPTAVLTSGYTGSITFDIAFESGQTTADISPLFTFVPESYTNDIILKCNALSGDYTLLFPTLPVVDDDSWKLFDGGVKQVDLADSNQSYTFTAPTSDMVFRWGVYVPVSIIPVSGNNGIIISEKYYTLTGIEIQQPTTAVSIKKVIYDNGVVEIIKTIKK